jgi:thioredoxin 1
MTDDDLKAIRERKRKELERQLRGDAEDGDGEGDESPSNAAPVDPVYVEGRDHLADLVERHNTVLVDFYADWCGPCQMLEPVVGRVAADTDAAVAKVDIDAHQQLAAEYNVRGVPTLVLFSGGDIAERLTGVPDEGRLTSLVERYS